VSHNGILSVILGPFGVDCDLRRWGLKLAERGGKSGKKRAIVATAKAGGAAASPLGERRSIPTIAQRQPNDRGGSRVKQNSKARIKTVPRREKTKAQAEFQ
jgi:hypothetical protein